MKFESSDLLKLFVLVPDTITDFDGSSLASSGKIYFDVNKRTIWARGTKFGFTKEESDLLDLILGTDKATGNATQQSIRAIAQDVVNNIASWQGADANNVISTLKEVLDWFNKLPEGDAGAVALVGKVGNPAELYTAEDQAQNAEHVAGTVKTAATGLYKLIEDSVAAKNVTADGASGELLVDATASNNKVEVSSTTKLQNAVTAAETSIQSITVAGTELTVSGNVNAKAAEITKTNLQSALFTNTYTSTPLSYSYINVIDVQLKETDGELTYLYVDASGIANRVVALENFDPWETYSVS